MNKRILELESLALEFVRAGDKKSAVPLLEELVRLCPEFERGLGFYQLACCYEELGQFELAQTCYRSAVQLSPEDEYFLGGFAGFLYVHGAPEEAFAAHIALLKADGWGEETLKSILPALSKLGNDLGLSNEELQNIMQRAQSET